MWPDPASGPSAQRPAGFSGRHAITARYTGDRSSAPSSRLPDSENPRLPGRPAAIQPKKERSSPGYIYRRRRGPVGRSRVAAAAPSPSFRGLRGPSLPSEKEELWRYTPIDELELGGYGQRRPGRRSDRRADGRRVLERSLRRTGRTKRPRGGTQWRPVSFVRTGLPEPVSLGGLAIASGETILGRWWATAIRCPSKRRVRSRRRRRRRPTGSARRRADCDRPLVRRRGGRRRRCPASFPRTVVRSAGTPGFGGRGCRRRSGSVRALVLR